MTKPRETKTVYVYERKIKHFDGIVMLAIRMPFEKMISLSSKKRLITSEIYKIMVAIFGLDTNRKHRIMPTKMTMVFSGIGNKNSNKKTIKSNQPKKKYKPFCSVSTKCRFTCGTAFNFVIGTFCN